MYIQNNADYFSYHAIIDMIIDEVYVDTCVIFVVKVNDASIDTLLY